MGFPDNVFEIFHTIENGFTGNPLYSALLFTEMKTEYALTTYTVYVKL